jgi:hypothetical protein
VQIHEISHVRKIIVGLSGRHVVILITEMRLYPSAQIIGRFINVHGVTAQKGILRRSIVPVIRMGYGHPGDNLCEFHPKDRFFAGIGIGLMTFQADRKIRFAVAVRLRYLEVPGEDAPRGSTMPVGVAAGVRRAGAKAC